MQSREFDDILASLQQIVRQAYALGRSDALKQVVDVLKNDTPGAARPLALMAPTDDPAEAAAASRAPGPDAAAAPEPPPGPWWTREPRRMR